MNSSTPTVRFMNGGRFASDVKFHELTWTFYTKRKWLLVFTISVRNKLEILKYKDRDNIVITYWNDADHYVHKHESNNPTLKRRVDELIDAGTQQKEWANIRNNNDALLNICDAIKEK